MHGRPNVPSGGKSPNQSVVKFEISFMHERLKVIGDHTKLFIILLRLLL